MTLFDMPAEPISPHRKPNLDTKAKPAKWSDLAQGTQTRCDHCIRAAHAGRRDGLVIEKARVRRKTEITDERLCGYHAAPLKEADDLEARKVAQAG